MVYNLFKLIVDIVLLIIIVLLCDIDGRFVNLYIVFNMLMNNIKNGEKFYRKRVIIFVLNGEVIVGWLCRLIILSII